MPEESFIDAMALYCKRCGGTFRGDEIFTNKHQPCGPAMRAQLLEGVFHEKEKPPHAPVKRQVPQSHQQKHRNRGSRR